MEIITTGVVEVVEVAGRIVAVTEVLAVEEEAQMHMLMEDKLLEPVVDRQ